MDALRVEVECEGDQIDVARALAVAEDATLDAVRARHLAELGGSDGRAPVVVRVQADEDAIALVQVVVHVLDLVGVHVGRGCLNRGGQVVDNLFLRCRLPDFGDRIADFKGELGFGGAENLGRVFVEPVGLGVFGHAVHDTAGAVDRDLPDLVAAHVEHDPAEIRGAGVIEVNHRLLRADAGLHGALDQFRPGLCQRDDLDIIGDAVFIDERAHEIKIGLRGGRKSDLDFLEADLDQHFKEAQLARHAHRFDQRLVAITQIGAHPDRRAGNPLAGPGAFVEIPHEWFEWDVLGCRVREHVCNLSSGARMRDLLESAQSLDWRWPGSGLCRISSISKERGKAVWRKVVAGLPRGARPGNRSLAVAIGRQNAMPVDRAPPDRVRSWTGSGRWEGSKALRRTHSCS